MMASEEMTIKRRVLGGAAMALLFALVSLVLAAPAGAQLPAQCDEYDDPTCVGPIDEEDRDTTGAGDNNIGPAGSSDGSGDGDGKLPFTGYPLTGLILLFLALLALGLAVRGGSAVRERVTRGPTGP